VSTIRSARIARSLSPASLYIGLPAQGCKQRVIAQLVMIIDILVAEADPIHPLSERLTNTVLAIPAVAPIGEAIGETVEDPSTQIHLTKQQRPGI
jgi:hypothetical protein